MMPSMNREEITHLANLARIRLTDEEVSALETDLSSIVSYVSTVTEIATEGGEEEPELTPRFNIFRQDEITNEPGQYTQVILQEMPATEGPFMKVKKILQTDE